MANRFLNNIRINDAYTFPASDGNDGQVITTDGAGNLAFENISPDAASVIYRDNFTGDGSTVTFDLQNSITDEDQTQIYIDGVYQEKSTYSISGTTITFTTAPILGHSVEVISISSINTGPTVLYQDNFTGNGSDTAFTLGQEIDNEIKTFIFLNGVYQFKNTYTVDGATLTFDTAPANGVAIEVVSIASAVQSDSLEAGSVIIPVKNTHTASISKGTPVYITGNVGASERLQIAPADASNSAKMPAAGLLLTTLAVNAQGYVVTGGYLRNITTDTIDGTSTTSNDTVYVKSGGGLTMTKPTGSTNYIQNIAKVARSSGGNSGSLLVSSILRTNDVPNLSTGKIWVGDGNTIESTVVHLDEPNSRLGINNNSPSYSLDVTGTTNISGALTGTTGTFSGVITGPAFRTTSGSTDYSLLTRNSTNTAVYIQQAGSGPIVDFRYGSQAAGQGTSTMLIKSDGNIGIGTTSPSAKLHIENGSSGAGSAWTNADELIIENSGNVGLTLQSPNTAAATIAFQDPQSVQAGWIQYLHADNAMRFATNGNFERMRIDSSGNVGIGKTSPSQKLDVEGSIRLNSELQIFTGTTDIGQISNSGGALNIQGTSTRDVSLGSDSYPQAVFIEGSNGRVGIGTTSPSHALDITSGAYDQVRWRRTSGVYGYLYSDSAGAGIYSGASFSQAGIYLVPNTSMDFRVNGSQRMYINSSGNVGIGTTSPTRQLTVNGTTSTVINIKSNTTNGLSFLALGDADDDNYAQILLDNSTNKLQIQNGGGGGITNRGITLDSSENVGIGTDSPDAKLSVHSAVNNSAIEIVPTTDDNNADTAVLRLWGTKFGTANRYSEIRNVTDGSTANNELAFNTNGSERMRIDSSGNVLIGASATTDGKLNIVADGETTNFVKLKSTKGTGNIYGFKTNGANSEVLAIMDITAGNRLAALGQSEVSFATGGTTRLLINSSGNVGIGTTSPTAKLEIVGSNGTNIFRGNFAGSADIFMGFDNANPYLILQDNSNVTTHLFQSNVNNYIVGSNLGIGTTSPSANLHVSSTSTATLKVGTTGVADASVDIRGYDAGVHIGDATNGLRWAIWNDGPSTSSSLKFGSYALGTWYGDGAQVVTMTSGGNVGIGTTNPYNKFVVKEGSNVDMEFGSESSGCFIQTYNRTSNAWGYLRFITAGAETMRLTTSGNVGIGTTSPQADLDVNDDLRVNRYHKNVFSYYTTASASNQYFHIKTGVGTNQVCMHMYHIEGYAYGTGAILDERFGFHTDSGGSIYGKSYKGTYANNIYKSSDNKVVIVFGPLNTYYMSFMVHLIESGMYTELFVKPTAATYSSSNSGAY